MASKEPEVEGGGEVDNRPISILIGVDNSNNSVRAFEWCVSYLKDRNIPGDRFHVLHVINIATGSALDPLHDNIDRAWNAEQKEQAKETREKFKALCTLDRIEMEWKCVNGDPRMLIVEEADILDPTMIVVGKRGLSMLAKLIMGSVSDYVMQHASCPVMVIH